MTRIDLNADLGEEITDDEGLLRVVTSANVACGFHAGTAEIMRAVCASAVLRGVRIGAQVSYDDREGFGRRPLDVAYAVLRDQVASQVGALTAIAESEGGTVAYVKPHGALYHRVVDDEEQAAAVLDGSASLPVLGLAGGVLLRRAAEQGRTVWREAFPDRTSLPPDAHGVRRLSPRDVPGAVLHDPAGIAAAALALAGRGDVDSLCVHGDAPAAVAAARSVRAALEAAGWVVGAP